MFKMRNAVGSAVLIAKTERRRDALLALGFTEVKEDAKINLDKLKVDELEAFAKEKGIDLSGCTNKAEMLEKIKKSIKE